MIERRSQHEDEFRRSLTSCKGFGGIDSTLGELPSWACLLSDGSAPEKMETPGQRGKIKLRSN